MPVLASVFSSIYVTLQEFDQFLLYINGRSFERLFNFVLQDINLAPSLRRARTNLGSNPQVS
jgi:hypothetical protein